MPALNITEDALRRLAVPESGRAVFTDTKLKGFSVVVGRQSRSFYAQRDVRGKTHKVCRLEWSRVLEDRLFIRENKSNRPFHLPLLDEHRAVIEAMKGLHKQYVFPDRTNKGPTVDPRHDDVPGTMHSLRHTFASIGAEVGVPDDIIARLLNHSSSKITSRYIAVDVEALREPMQKIVGEIMRRLNETTDAADEEEQHELPLAA